MPVVDYSFSIGMLFFWLWYGESESFGTLHVNESVNGLMPSRADGGGRGASGTTGKIFVDIRDTGHGL